ncbi:acyl-CoA/acyl-ACP dehydrogenase [Alcaligenaceae bacterium]|nr:acyl-CoA/acyl-ACP dehydrogenase [Alcaligenaceae bacterium]
MRELHDMMIQAADRILLDLAAPGRSGEHHAALLWRAFDDAGFPSALASEDKGGAGLRWAHAFSLLYAVGRHAAPLPLAEALVARWLLAAAGLDIPAGLAVCVPAGRLDTKDRPEGRATLSGVLHRVPWGRAASTLVILADHESGPRLLTLDNAALQSFWHEGVNLAGEPRDTLRLGVPATAPWHSAPIGEQALYALGAATRSAMMAGALRGITELGIDYANLRHQFGRPIGRFQVIQHQLALLAAHCAAARASAEAAFEALDHALAHIPGAPQNDLAVQAAKIRCGEAAGLGASIAHQTFGAIGFTEEHLLHHYTKRLWSWRDEFGNEAFWSAKLGRQTLLAGSDALWPALTDDKAACQ